MKLLKKGLSVFLSAALLCGAMACPVAAADSNQSVRIDFWKSSKNEASMGNVATDNNRQALYIAESNTLQVGTNPVDVSGYRSAIVAAQYDKTGNGDYVDVTTLTTGTVDTGTKNDGVNHTLTYLSSFAIELPDYIKKTGIEYIPMKMSVPYTPMDVVVGTGYLDMRLKIDWDQSTVTTDTQLIPDTNISSGSVATVDLSDSATGISLSTDTTKVSEEAVLSVSRVTSGTDYKTAETALSGVADSFTLYKVSLIVNGAETQPFGTVNIKFPYTGSDLKLYRINDGGTKTVLKGESGTDGYTILTSKLGLFAVSGGTQISSGSITGSGFTDISGHWAESYITRAVEDKLFNGTSATSFTPDGRMTCGMLLTVVYRMAGEPAVSGSSSYATVKAGSWYEKAVVWAEQNKLIGDYGPAFDPNKNITREELATVLYRYEKMQGTPAADKDISSYTDSSSVSDWAKDSISWAAGAGIVQGRASGGQVSIAPAAESTRAEVATMLCRYMDYKA